MKNVDSIAKPLVSVIMPAYNVEPYIAEAIDSVLKQTFVEFELIIADDASADGTLSIIRSYNDPRIRVVQHLENLGYVGNMNFLFQEAKGDFILIQDADDYCDPNRISYLSNFLKANPKVGLVGSSYFKVDSLGMKELVSLPTDIELIKQSFDQMKYPLPVVNGCSMLRKEIIEQGFLFRNLNYVNRAQDDDWLFRLSENFVMANVSEPLYYYRSNQASMTLNPAHVNPNNLWAADFVQFLKKYRVEKGIDLLTQDYSSKIDSFFGERRHEVLDGNPGFFELYNASKYLGVHDRKNAVKWYVAALLKDPFNAYIWKKIVWVLLH